MPTESQVAVEGVRFHLYRAAPARKRKTTPALLLHGVPETARCWSRLMPELAKDRLVLAPDLKGLGGSEAREPYDIPTMAAELAALVLHEVDGPVDVVGHDWGGSIGLALAGARPELVRRLVVISAPYRQVDLKAAWHMPLLALPLLPEVAFRLAGDKMVRLVFEHAWKAPGEPEHLEEYVAAYTPPDRVAAMLAYYRQAVRPRLAKVLTGAKPSGSPRVQVERALVVWGTDDPPMPVHVAESVVRDLGPQATLMTLPGVGHWPVEEAPELVVPAITEFLRAL
jgi:haloacetate dehalogenase